MLKNIIKFSVMLTVLVSAHVSFAQDLNDNLCESNDVSKWVEQFEASLISSVELGLLVKSCAVSMSHLTISNELKIDLDRYTQLVAEGNISNSEYKLLVQGVLAALTMQR